MDSKVQPDDPGRKRMTVVLGWISGATLGIAVNGLVHWSVGDEYPVGPTTFAFFVAGAFGGTRIADRFGERAFAPLAIATGVLLALVLAGGLILLSRES